MPDKTILLTTDLQQSVLSAVKTDQAHNIAHTPYGYRPHGSSLLSQIGFNGQMPDPVTGHYHLGNGYRQYNPVLMRFNSPDSWSPFRSGGLNTYMYCAGEPITRADPSGHLFFGLIGRRQHKLIGPTVKYLNHRVTKFGGRSGLSSETIDSLIATKQRLGSTTSLSEEASLMSISPHELLVRSMPEMQVPELTKFPTQATLRRLTPSARAKRTAAAERRIFKLKHKEKVLDDIIDGAASHIGEDALALWELTQRSLTNEQNIILALTPPPAYAPYDLNLPPPSYQDAMRIRG